MRIVSFIEPTQPDVIDAILTHCGLADEPPRAPPNVTSHQSTYPFVIERLKQTRALFYTKVPETGAINDRIDPSRSAPLYLQIAEAIRDKIEAGELTPGDELVPLRKAADAFGVNLHTLRHAYTALAREGLVETEGPRRTRVRSLGPSSNKSDDVDTFVEGVMGEAHARFRLSRAALARAITSRAGQSDLGRPVVHVVECSEWQCDAYARELEDAWSVDARSWSLERDGELPPGRIIATFFHYNDIRRRWPHRLREVHFMTIRPDPELAKQLPAPGDDGAPVKLIVCEYDEPTAQTIAADISVVLPPPRYELEIVAQAEPRALLSDVGRGTFVLYPPRVWADLDQSQRDHPSAIEARYMFDAAELSAVGAEFAWQRPDANLQQST